MSTAPGLRRSRTGRPTFQLTPAQVRRFAAEVEVLRLTDGGQRSARWCCEVVLGFAPQQTRLVLARLGEVES
jgi:hypothetical protein